MDKNPSGFTKAQVKTFVKDVLKEFGTGWNYLVPRLKEACIAEKALLILGIQAAEKLDTDRLHTLLGEMLVEAGLREGE